MTRHFVFIVFAALALRVSAQNAPQAALVGSELIFEQAPFPQCHAASVVELPDGELFAVWFGGSYERHPDVCIWGARKSAAGWSAPVLLADGIVHDTLRYPCWNPVLFRSPKGPLLLYYKVGASPIAWAGWYKQSLDNGRSWSAATPLPEGILGPIKNKPFCTAEGRIVSPSSTERGDAWHAHMELSNDGGYSWSKVPLDTSAGFRLIQPTLLALKDGALLALMRSNQHYIVESKSLDGGMSWSKPAKTSLPNPNSGIDALTLRDGLHVLVYNPTGAGKEWYEGRCKLFVAVSRDGVQWQDVYRLEDRVSGEYSYPAVIQSADGLVHIVYTADRKHIRHTTLKITF